MDLGGGSSGQYFADKCLNDSASTHDIRPFLASLAASILGPKESKFHLEVEASPHNLFDEFFVLGEISLLANRRKTLLPLGLELELHGAA